MSGDILKIKLHYGFIDLLRMLEESDTTFVVIADPTFKMPQCTIIKQGENIIAIGINDGRPTLKPGDSLIIDGGVAKLKPNSASYTDPVKQVLSEQGIALPLLIYSDDPIVYEVRFGSEDESFSYSYMGQRARVFGDYSLQEVRKSHEPFAYNYSHGHGYFWNQRITGGDVIILSTGAGSFEYGGSKYHRVIDKIIVRSSADSIQVARFLKQFFAHENLNFEDQVFLEKRTDINNEFFFKEAEMMLLKILKLVDTAKLHAFLTENWQAYREDPSHSLVMQARMFLISDKNPNRLKAQLLKLLGSFEIQKGRYLYAYLVNEEIRIDAYPDLEKDEFRTLFALGQRDFANIERYHLVVSSLYESKGLEKWLNHVLGNPA